VRTRWFDDEVVHALTAGGAPAVRAAVMVLTATGRVAVALAPPPPAPAPPRQVLVAGAGMDARAWRLPLPSGTAWYEVDAVGVLRAKARALAGGAGAGGVPTAVTTRDGAVPVASGGALARRGPPRHPLKAASLSFVAADLASPGWSAPLVAAGFDPAAPSVTVAEGLVMYLPGEAGAASFLRELAAVAAPGSVLLLVAVTAATAADARARANGAGLMAAWTFGCDPDPAPLLAACGWRVVGVDTRSDMARRYAAPGREWGFPVRPASPVRAERESLFVVAVRAPMGGGRG
jgi:O-methyltransferase involved in polyketide biosynthesis